MRGVALCEPSIGDSDCSKFSEGDGPTVVPGWILGVYPAFKPDAARGGSEREEDDAAAAAGFSILIGRGGERRLGRLGG
jgi:hypothetical protein